MKSILFQNTQNSYLPEVQAYKEYFESKGYNILTEGENSIPDIYWKIMGLDFKSRDKPVIHDYASLSSGGIFPKIKDLIKSSFNAKPDLRLFLNHDVKNCLNFRDNIPFLIRDAGIHKSFFNLTSSKKEYDFVYLGTLSKVRGVHKLIEFFSNKLKNKKLLLIGSVPKELNSIVKKSKNIICTGRLPLSQVPIYASKAIYGINYIPDKYPFNIQASLKLLEYCALGLKVITTDYYWINSFEKKNNARFFKIKEDFSNFRPDAFEKFDFVTPNLKHREWNNMFNEIDLYNVINSLRK